MHTPNEFVTSLNRHSKDIVCRTTCATMLHLFLVRIVAHQIRLLLCIFGFKIPHRSITPNITHFEGVYDNDYRQQPLYHIKTKMPSDCKARSQKHETI